MPRPLPLSQATCRRLPRSGPHPLLASHPPNLLACTCSTSLLRLPNSRSGSSRWHADSTISVARTPSAAPLTPSTLSITSVHVPLATASHPQPLLTLPPLPPMPPHPSQAHWLLRSRGHHLGLIEVESRPDPPSPRAMFDAFNALLHAQPQVCHHEEGRPEANSEEETPVAQGQRERSCSVQHGADWLSLKSYDQYCSNWYQGALQLVSCGFSVVSAMRRKCFPDLASGSGRAFDLHTPTRDALTVAHAIHRQCRAASKLVLS